MAGIAYNAAPYALTALAVRLARPDPDSEATYKMLGGSLIYPVCWAAEAGLAWMVAGVPGLAVFLVTLLPASLLALGWADRLVRVGGRISSAIRLAADRDLRRHLLDRRREIGDALARLQQEVPESVLAGEAAREPGDSGGQDPAGREASEGHGQGEPDDFGGRGPASREASEGQGKAR